MRAASRYDGPDKTGPDARPQGGRVSNPDSFINEVTEEVRRDQLYQYLRRYGWIALVVVLLLVGGAAYNEWRKAQIANAAQAMGDALLDALSTEEESARAAAMAAVSAEGPAAAVAGLLTAAEQERAGDVAGAVATLDRLAQDTAADAIYRELATLKSLMLQADTMDPATRRDAFGVLATPGAAFRLLALEQIALADIAAGDAEAALVGLRAITEDAEVTPALNDRAQSLIIALGGTLDAEEAASE